MSNTVDLYFPERCAAFIVCLRLIWCSADARDTNIAPGAQFAAARSAIFKLVEFCCPHEPSSPDENLPGAATMLIDEVRRLLLRTVQVAEVRVQALACRYGLPRARERGLM